MTQLAENATLEDIYNTPKAKALARAVLDSSEETTQEVLRNFLEEAGIAREKEE